MLSFWLTSPYVSSAMSTYNMIYIYTIYIYTIYIQYIYIYTIYIYTIYIQYIYIQYIYNIITCYIHIYNYVGRMCLVAPMLLLIRMRSVCIQLNTNVIRGLWNVHNFCDTCTTSVKSAQLLGNVHNFCETCTTAGKRAQHLWHVHNISETCTTSLKRAHIEYRILENTGWGRWNTLYPYMIIYVFMYTYIYIYNHMYISPS